MPTGYGISLKLKVEKMLKRFFGNLTPVKLWSLIVGGVLAVICALIAIFIPQFAHALFRLVHDWAIPLIIATVVATAGIYFACKMPGRNDTGFYYSVTPASVIWTYIGTGVATVLLFVTAIIVGNYFASSNVYEASNVKTTSADDLSFDTRAPYDVASATSSRTLGDTNGDSTGAVKANPANETYSVSIKKRGIGKGYESVQSMNLPEFGSPKSENVTFCEYSDNAPLRLGGLLPSNSLNRALAHRTALNVGWDSGDAIAVCADKDHPILYVPLKKSVGFLGVHDVPAGVAIYDGKTGDLTIEKDLKNVSSDTPIYPQSIAKDQRNSVASSQGFADWFFQRAGFEDTNKGDDPNGDNATEFAMQKEEGDIVYVTPVTPRGSSSSIVGLTTVDSTSVKSGEFNKLYINRYETARKATSTVAADIIGGTLSGYKASGLTVFEVVPGPDGTWVASIGRDQSILYRASIDSEGAIKLIDGDDKPKDANDEGDKLDTSTSKPLEDMSNEELKELGDEILEELASRSDG